MVTLTLDEVFKLSKDALMVCGATQSNAEAMAQSIREAEAEGIRNVGLGFLPFYCRHLLTGAIVGDAVPKVADRSPALVTVDGGNGFAHPAFDAAEDQLHRKAGSLGLAALSIHNVYYNGVVGYFVKRLAERNLIGLACTHASSTVAPYGGCKPLFGTNPLAFGVPRLGKPPLVIDLSTSATAFVNVAAAAAEGKSIPDNWAYDNRGQATTDPNEGLKGSLQPLGGAKGTGLALMVEILAAGLCGDRWSFELPELNDEMREPPALGQFYLAIDLETFGGDGFLTRIEQLLMEASSQPGVRLPGDRRLATRARAESEGVQLDDGLFQTIKSYAQGT